MALNTQITDFKLLTDLCPFLHPHRLTLHLLRGLSAKNIFTESLLDTEMQENIRKQSTRQIQIKRHLSFRGFNKTSVTQFNLKRNLNNVLILKQPSEYLTELIVLAQISVLRGDKILIILVKKIYKQG